MEPFRFDLLIFTLNTVLIASILAAPLLIGLLIIRLLRKWLVEDRRTFEDDITSKLGEIVKTQAELKMELSELK